MKRDRVKTTGARICISSWRRAARGSSTDKKRRGASERERGEIVIIPTRVHVCCGSGPEMRRITPRDFFAPARGGSQVLSLSSPQARNFSLSLSLYMYSSSLFFQLKVIVFSLCPRCPSRARSLLSFISRRE